MSTKIQIKRSSTASSSPVSADLEIGELAINVTDKILYSKDSGGTIFTVASGANTYTLPTASTTVLGGIKVGTNLTISNGVLSSTDTTYTGTGLISINGSNVISTTANNYSHPSGDGNLHVPATSTSNDGKVLTAGSTAGSLSWTTPASTYTLPTASSSALGGIKIGYTESGKNYPVELSSGKAFVNVPWSGGNYVSSTTAPASPVNGDHWFDSAEGILYLRLDSNWVDVTTASAASGGGSSMGGTMTSHIIPDTNDVYDIGSATYKIRDLYVGENSLHIGDADISSVTNSSGYSWLILPNIEMTGHIIPDTDDVYDIGSAEFKIRDMFVSDNSLWIGDNHKITTSGGKKKTKKRKKGKTPKKIYDVLIGPGKAFDNETALKDKFKEEIHDPAPDPTIDPGHVDFHPPMHKWFEFSLLHGQSEFKRPEDIFDNTDDFADEVDGGGAMEFVSQTTVSSSTASVAFTNLNSSSYDRYVLHVEADMQTSSHLMLRMSSNNGTSYDATSNYYTLGQANGYIVTKTAFPQGYLAYASGDTHHATLTMIPSSAVILVNGLAQRPVYPANNVMSTVSIGNTNLSTFNSIQILNTSGWNITSGVFTLYGIKD